ncbi:hypothetical protein BD310DRAFT_829673 [Dichomitus squalens]|uniref:YEATS domain-containing protein n=1 Tax=Dichomitus squalens TaxID=114155 RepID=A0A4Q9PFB1_9APHY|nr:hypothetical protein BD310DRAFT_829673 [Dichomitus squalens]
MNGQGRDRERQQIALEEIDLEISIRQRIAEAIHSRLTWATLLRQSLQHTSLGQGSEDFRVASLDALGAIEAPCDPIFSRENRLALPLPPPNTPPPPAAPPEPPQNLTRSTRTRGVSRVPPPPPKRLLFLRNSTTSPPEIAKLACPQCARFDFSTLQGLLNHCRLRHQLEYGSHDECVQRCAVLVPEEEREWVVQNGIEVAGISLPSLRRLFEIAVGAGDSARLPPLPGSSKSAAPAQPPAQSDVNDEPGAPSAPDVRDDAAALSTTVTRTLGYHADTPALAHFLGRAPKKRQIHVRAKEDDPVDIEDVSAGSGLQPRRRWRKRYVHRNVARRELDEVVPLSELQTNAIDESVHGHEAQGPQAEGHPSSLHTLAGTRFHIAARVQVADHSLYIPPARRPPDHPDHTHRWRLTVTAPSYSLPISAVLSTLTVTSATDPSPPPLAQPVTLSAPPFVVTGTADRPFLARLAFAWAGTMNPVTEVEHWVELDPMQYATPQLGEEQVFDVELDRRTELLPVREDAGEAEWDIWDARSPVPQGADDRQEQEQEEEPAPEWVAKLKSLLPRFPMTMRDTKGRSFTGGDKLPYTLVSTPAQFLSLQYGRRKAIEMGRARALREAYIQLVSQKPSSSEAQPGTDAAEPPPNSSSASAFPLQQLSTVDVFRWLEDEGLLPRNSSKAAGPLVDFHTRSRSSRRTRDEAEPPPTLSPAYCRACGLERAQHPTAADFAPGTVVDGPGASPLPIATARGAATHGLAVCTTFQERTRPLVVDVATLLGRRLGEGEDMGETPYGLHPTIFTPRAIKKEEEEEEEAQGGRSSSRSAVHLFPASGPRAATATEMNAALVEVADPRLVVAIRGMTGLPFARNIPAQRLPRPETRRKTQDEHHGDDDDESELSSSASLLGPIHLASLNRLGVTDEPREALNARLAPSALLAVALRSLVSQLVQRGVDAFRRDEAALRDQGVGFAARHERMRRNATEAGNSISRVLTPAHVLGGVARHARTGVADSALFLVCATLGDARPKSFSTRLEATGTDVGGVRRCIVGAQDADGDAPTSADILGFPLASAVVRAEEARVHYRRDDGSPVALLRAQEVDRRDRANGGADILDAGEKDCCTMGVLSGEDLPEDGMRGAEAGSVIVKAEIVEE